jgi:7,8-dihydropterin-6-yl-methyl-4-(beta-D-ribofuranosyl)aminobenzene 5'-phosphate synthase
MRITSLIENDCSQGRNDLHAEFGLALHVQTEDHSILFDTGTTGAFADNAAAMEIDLAAVDLAVLSHQHFDHGGGLKRFFDVNDTAPVYLRDAKIEDRWSKAFGVLKRPIGVDRSLILRRTDRFRFLKTDTEIAPGVWILTWIGTKHPRPNGNRRLYVARGKVLEPDPFDHELVMVVRESDGMVVFSGCSHSGILNMVDSAKTRFPNDPVKAVVGGFHLMGLPWFNTMAVPRLEVEEIARQMLDRVEGPVFTGHCTGKKGFGVLKGVMGDSLQPFSTGATAEV